MSGKHWLAAFAGWVVAMAVALGVAVAIDLGDNTLLGVLLGTAFGLAGYWGGIILYERHRERS